MPSVFVHGVPDTVRVWDEVFAKLNANSCRALALPGFGNVPPDGFPANKESYVDWIIAEIERMQHPVDLVGHDWGCMLALRVASIRPDLIRTVAGGNGSISAAYEFHPLAKIWQTPDEGEKFMSQLTPPKLSQVLQSLGVDQCSADGTASRVDDTMKNCILRLYRSAIDVGREWEPDLKKISSPALVFWGKNDKECPVRFAHEMAQQMPRGRAVELDCKHWVPYEKPQELAQSLREHWESADVSNAAGSPV